MQKGVLLFLLFSPLALSAGQTPVVHPVTQGQVARPVTQTVVTKPTTAGQVTHPVTAPVAVTHPVTQTVVTKPTTLPVAVSRPQSVVPVTKPVSSTVVTHPTTQPVSVQGEQPVAKKQISSVSAEGNSRNAQTSMSGFKPKEAKDFKAADISNATTGLSSTPENAPQNSTMDKMRHSSFVSSDPMANAPKVGNVSSSGIAKVVNDKVGNTSKK